MSAATYQPSKVRAVWGSIPLRGFMDGTFISVQRSEDVFTRTVGAYGDNTRVQSHDRGGEITFTLQLASPVNDLLSAQMRIDELFASAVYPFILRDLNGTTVCSAANAWLRRPANVEYMTDAVSREWMLDADDIDMNVGSITNISI